MAVSLHKLSLSVVLTFALTIPTLVFGAEPAAAGNALRWPKGTIKLALSSSLFSNQNSIKSGSNVTRSLVRAISIWEAVADVQIEIVSSDLISANAADGAGDGVSLITAEPTNENLTLFSKQVNATAVTRVFFNARNDISEADIALNPMYQFSDDGTPGTYDLTRVLAHEIGHLLGLKHSTIPSALMFDEVQKNGLSWSSGQTVRLAPEDTAKVRALYGGSLETVDCCSTVSGNVVGFTGKGTVFAIDPRNGSVISSAQILKAGSFEFSGLPEGTYDLWLSGVKTTLGEMGDALLGRVTVVSGEGKVLNLKARAESVDFRIDRLGTVGRLSKRPVTLERGRVNSIIISGYALNSGSMKFGTTSRSVRVLSVKDVSNSFGKGETVVQIELEVPAETPAGDLGVFVENEKGSRKHVFGVLTVN